MKVERTIESLPFDIDSVGIYDEGIYSVSINAKDSVIWFIDRVGVSESFQILIESRILDHIAFEIDSKSLVAIIWADNTFKVIEALTGRILLNKPLASLSKMNPNSVTMYLINDLSSSRTDLSSNSKWICAVVDYQNLLFISTKDWHTISPVNNVFDNIDIIVEWNGTKSLLAIIWNDYSENTQKKCLSLTKMPQEADEDNFECDHFDISEYLSDFDAGKSVDLLDWVAVHDSILILLQSGGQTNLIQFWVRNMQNPFTYIGSMPKSKNQFLLGRIIAETYCLNELAVSAYFVYSKWQNILIFEFGSKNESLGTQAHAKKFNDYIRATSNKNLLSQSENSKQLEIFTDEQIITDLKLGYFENIASTLLYKQPGTDGYHTNMADLRDFINKWISKFDSEINNKVTGAVLRYWNPDAYGNCLEKKEDIVRNINEIHKAISSLAKLYRYIFHRRLLEAKEKQKNLKQDRLNVNDKADIKMIERKWVQVEASLKFLNYMKWFLINDFFIYYNFELLDKNHKERQKQKRLHYKENLKQMIKNLILVDNLFIDKIFEDSKIKGDSPQANYGFLLKNSNFSNLNYEIKQNDENEPEPEVLSYPLKNIEEFILLLKITNVDRIKDYICFYTLLDLGYTENSQALQELILENKSETTFKEILFYWRLETSFVHSGLIERIPSDIQGIDKIPYQWIASVLQTLIELKNHDVTMATLSAKSDGFDDPRTQKSFELMVYLQCELGKYNQAFMMLLSIEDKVNNIRYKNIYQMFLNHILMNKKFELLCSYHLSERQEELTKDYLQSSESDLNQLYYLSFLASRGTTLEGLKYAKAFFDKLKSESEDKSRFGAEQASMMTEIVAYLIKYYSHVLPPIHKKFAFDYLKLESGKFHLAINAKKLKDNRIKAERKDSMDVDQDVSSQWFSDQGKYSPFTNDKVSQIMDTRMPKTFEDPYRASVRKNDLSGKKSMIKNFQTIKKNEDSTLANIFDAVRM